MSGPGLSPGSPPKSAAAREAHERGLAFLGRCRAGDDGIQEEFLASYGPLVRFAMSSVLRQKGVALEPEDIDDLFQTLLLSFFDQDCRRLKMYEGRSGASLATFIRVCSTRQTLDYLRRRQRQPTLVHESADDDRPGLLEEMADEAASPEEDAATAETLRRLGELVAALPPREQVLIRLHFVEGQSIPEVARALGITDNAAHVLKSRLRTKLRQRMESARDD